VNDSSSTSPGARTSLLRWQWEGYARFHADRTNLLLHIVLVPLFWVGAGLLVAGLGGLALVPALAGVGTMGFSIAVQGRGHRREANPSIPFAGPGQAIARILLEQFVNFPRYVLTGGWLRALRTA
jgi:hypothetical protein